MKKILVIIIGLLFITGCTGNKTLDERFKKRGYKEYDGNYIKNLTDTDYYLFDINGPIKSFTYETLGVVRTYFLDNNWAAMEGCQYDFIAKKPLEGSDCSEDDIVGLDNLLNFYINELDKLKIKKEELLVVPITNIENNDNKDVTE